MFENGIKEKFNEMPISFALTISNCVALAIRFERTCLYELQKQMVNDCKFRKLAYMNYESSVLYLDEQDKTRLRLHNDSSFKEGKLRGTCVGLTPCMYVTPRLTNV